MRTAAKFGIHFKLRAEREKDGKAPVYMGIVVNGEKIYIALKSFQADVQHWDKRNGGGKKTTKQGREINQYLDEMRLLMRSHYQDMEAGGTLITTEALKDAFLNISHEELPPTFADLVKYHNDQGIALLSPGTMRHYHVTQRYLVKFFQEQYKSADIELSKLDYKFIADFERFLYAHKPKDHQRKMDTNGVLKHLIRLKKMVNLGVNLNWLPNDPFRNFRLTRKKVEKEFLNDWELQRIEEKVFEVDRLTVARDLFVFSCYTGLAFVDMAALTRENIITGLDGEPWIKTYRQKTQVPVSTPLLPKALTILERYRADTRAEFKGLLFPMISNQKMNAYLKEIAKLCGVKKNMTYHVARHTFATTVTLSNGVPIETVSRMLGHSKLATTQIYARVLEKKISEDMAALRLKLG